jgi:DNA-binding transcriptional regulator YhcF (GntR family)
MCVVNVFLGGGEGKQKLFFSLWVDFFENTKYSICGTTESNLHDVYGTIDMPIAPPTKRETIRHGLISEINSGKLVPGQKLPGGNQLANCYGVSTKTLHLVLDDMEREGILIRKHRSGTYVVEKKTDQMTVGIPISNPKKLLLKHLWGKFLEQGHSSHVPVSLKQLPHDVLPSGIKTHHQVMEMFMRSEPAALFEIAMTDLQWLADLGLCEDLTRRFSLWDQATNFHPIAISGVTCGGRIYAVPFHCTLGGLVYDGQDLRQAGVEPERMSESLDIFVKTVERLRQVYPDKIPFSSQTARFFFLAVLHEFYEDFTRHISTGAVIDRATGVEVLRTLHYLQWNLGAVIFHPNRQGTTFQDFSAGRISVMASSLIPKAQYHLQHKMPRDWEVGFTPFGFGVGNRLFCPFNAWVWIINSRLPGEVRDFVWSCLQNYIQPKSEYELDIRHLEEGEINSRNCVFMQRPQRVPPDESYEELVDKCFSCAELEIPFPMANFDWFVVAASRMLMDSEANAEKEYEFYLAMVGQDFEQRSMLG